MANRATKIVSAIFVGAILGIPVSTLAKDAMGGADVSAPDSSAASASGSTDCLTTPNRELSQQGQRWFYRIEPGTNKRCWYMREQAERGSQTASPRSGSAQSLSPAAAQSLSATMPPAPKAFSGGPQTSRALSNARAELGPRSTGAANAGPTVPKEPVFITTGSVGANRGTSVRADAIQGPAETLTSPDSTNDAITGSSADGTTADGLNANANLNTGLSPSASAEMPTTANMPQEKGASLQVLFLVILGALAFAGLMANLIHRVARIWGRRHGRLRRHSIWRAVEEQRHAGRGQDRRTAAGAQRGDHSGQIRRFLTQIANQAKGKPKKRTPAKPQAASAARARTPSARRGVRASTARP